MSRGVSAAYAGDTVVVMDGTYDNEGQVAQSSGGGSVVTVSHAGTASSPITIMAQHRGGAILNAASTTQAWIGCYGAWAYFDVSYTSFVVIQGFVIENACFVGIHSNGNAHDVTIRWNEFRNIGNWNSPGGSWNPQGLYLNQSEYNFTIDGNSFHDIGGGTHINLQHAVYSQGHNVTIVNNIFYNQKYGWDIQLSEGNTIVIANNTFAFYNPNRLGQIILYDGGIANSLSNILIENNVFYNPQGYAVTAELDGGGNIANCVMKNNLTTVGTLFDNGSTYGGGGVTCSQSGTMLGSDPKLANTSTAPYDFHIQAGSPAIGSGTTDSSTTVDFDNWPRPVNSAYALGAYEYHVASGISLSASPSSVSVLQGSTVTTTIAATVTGSASPSFSTSGLPAGVTASFFPSNCSGSCTTTLTLSATGTYQGSGSVTIGATSGSVTASTPLGLTVNPAPVTAPPISSGSGGDYTTGLVARWTLFGTATDSVAGAKGTLHGGATWGTGQINGTSFSDLQLDGSSGYISVGETSQLEMTQHLTVSFWVRSAPTPSGSSTDPRIIAKLYDWDIKLNGNLYPQFSSSVGYAEANYPLPFSTWAHIVFTYSGGSVTAYVNGQPVGLRANTFTAGALPNYAYGLFIGTDSSATSFLSGTLSDVRIYNRTLSATDVSALYSGTTPGASAATTGGASAGTTPTPTPSPTPTPVPAPTGDYTNGLVGRWKLLGNAVDSVHGANGTLHGAAGWGNGTYSGVSFSDLVLYGTNGYVSVPEASQFEVTQQLTVSFWVRALPTASSSVSDPRIIAKAYDWDIKLNGNKYLQFSAAGRYAIVNSQLPLSTWTHIVFTFSGGSVKAYVNGKAAGFQTNTFTTASALPNYQYGLYFGTDSSVTNFLTGALSDVRIYTRALSAADVAALYSSITPATLI